MKMAASLFLFVLFIPMAVWAQKASSADGSETSWRSAENYAAEAKKANTSNVMVLIQGNGSSSNSPWACATCHGSMGQGALNIPRLAGISSGYLVKQLHDFKRGLRINSSMQYVVSKLTDTEMAALGAYYASLAAPPSSKASLGGDLDRGRALALEGDWSVNVPACFSCHGSLGWGVDDTFPAIAGQHPAYIHSQLADWKSGRRVNSPLGLMHSIAQSLSEKDIRAVSDFLATLPPPQSPNTEHR